jgi:hypothetical protein
MLNRAPRTLDASDGLLNLHLKATVREQKGKSVVNQDLHLKLNNSFGLREWAYLMCIKEYVHEKTVALEITDCMRGIEQRRVRIVI